MVLCLAFAFGVLIIATSNIFTAMYSVITIGAVLTSVCGFIYCIGWKLGIGESLGLDLFVGFSVDYVVHVAHCY